jgi:hypothetical protein
MSGYCTDERRQDLEEHVEECRDRLARCLKSRTRFPDQTPFYKELNQASKALNQAESQLSLFELENQG